MARKKPTDNTLEPVERKAGFIEPELPQGLDPEYRAKVGLSPPLITKLSPAASLSDAVKKINEIIAHI